MCEKILISAFISTGHNFITVHLDFSLFYYRIDLFRSKPAQANSTLPAPKSPTSIGLASPFQKLRLKSIEAKCSLLSLKTI
jgi:hypothetical protein